MTLNLDADSLTTLASNQALLGEFPFLRELTKKSPPGCCGKPGSVVDVRRVIDGIFSLPQDRKLVFKRLTGVTTVTARVVRAAQVVVLEF